MKNNGKFYLFLLGTAVVACIASQKVTLKSPDITFTDKKVQASMVSFTEGSVSKEDKITPLMDNEPNPVFRYLENAPKRMDFATSKQYMTEIMKMSESRMKWKYKNPLGLEVTETYVMND